MTQSNSPSKEEIEKYLFHELISSEREKIEEQLFEDNDFFYEVLLLEDDLVDLYVIGKLEGDQLARFENSLQASPERREKVASAQALQRRIAELAEEKRVVAGALEFSPWKRLPTFIGLRSPLFQYAVAGLFILLIVGIVFLLVERRQLNQEIARLNENQRSEEDRRQERMLQERIQASQDREEEVKRQLETERGETKAAREQVQLATSEREKVERELEELRRKRGSPIELVPTAIAQVYLQPYASGRRGSIKEKVLGSDTRGLAMSLELEAGSELTTPISVEINGKKEPIDVELHNLSSRIWLASISVAPRRLADGMNKIILKNADNDEIGSYRLIIKRR